MALANPDGSIVVAPTLKADEVEATTARAFAFLRDLNECSPRAIQPWFDEDSVVWIPPAKPIRSQRRIVRFFEAVFSRYAELHWEAVRVIPVTATLVIYEVRSWGTLLPDKPYENRVLTIVELTSSGTIRSLSDFFKDTTAFSAPAAPRPTG